MTLEQNPYDIPDEISNSLSGSLGQDDSIQLPFSTAFAWAYNGDQRLSQQGGVAYFGGWCLDEAAFVEHLNNENVETPPGFVLQQFSGNDGEYNAFTIRSIAVAPIAYRKRDANQGEPGKSFRSHVQLLGLAMVHDGQKKYELGPIILTAKGYQASNITRAFGEWERASAEPRRQHANNLDSKLFYLPVGTFGDKPNFEKVGKNVQSTITPIEPQFPDEITDQVLRSRYVGRDNAIRMAEMKEQAQEWLNDAIWLGKQTEPQNKVDESRFVEYVPEDEETEFEF